MAVADMLVAVEVAALELAPAGNLLLVALRIQVKGLAAAAAQTLAAVMATVLAVAVEVLVVMENPLKVVWVVMVVQEHIGHTTSQLFLAVAVAVALIVPLLVVLVVLMVAETAETELIHRLLGLLILAVAVAVADTQVIGLVVTAVLALSSLLTTTLLKEVQEEL
jgi:hypothetical protein